MGISGIRTWLARKNAGEQASSAIAIAGSDSKTFGEETKRHHRDERKRQHRDMQGNLVLRKKQLHSASHAGTSGGLAYVTKADFGVPSQLI